MNRRLLAAGLALVCLLTACGAEPGGGAKAESRPTVEASRAASFETAAGGRPSPSPSPLLAVAPAAAAGGLCRSFDYARVAAAIGVRFDVAAASGEAGATQVCVLQRVGFDAPDLVLSKIPVEKPSAPAGAEAGGDAAVEAYRADYQPKGAKKVTGLGKAAYSRIVAGEAEEGAQVEVGWLGAENVYVLAYTTAPTTTVAVAAKDVPRLIGLARQVA